ncbi:adenosylcobinamide-GDP ribazoletransferase [Clostridium fermenticellae]|uniref:Adenosylcobinamide-GDP ribazoletransferase n=1 Tax=Clostridium fermenticellae TaxID=2068654 RepID=A0A386H206_9CLOT|nr:adenosylcobinamide-GDP ribazoletransferase [Clostridium fermenticellae]AYD39729.1 adenosylcobinamide-GDP ribazoletransferase [Clostridium fermenticellae]
MKRIFLNFLLMVQFLTKIPVKFNLPCELSDFKRGAAFMPLIGLIIGTVQFFAYKGLVMILPLNVTIVLIVTIGIFITGGFHLDGLGDTCDGFFAFKEDKKAIDIMKDSRIGTYSCISLIIDILLKYTLLYFIVPKFPIAIIASPMIARLCTVFIACIGKTAKSSGTGNLFISNVGKLQFFIAFLITSVILSLVMNPKYVLMLVFSGAIFTVIFNLFCDIKIGGLTGDTLGASNELNEIFSLMLIAIIMK